VIAQPKSTLTTLQQQAQVPEFVDQHCTVAGFEQLNGKFIGKSQRQLLCRHCA
jgi:hypothetical protein